MGVTLRWPAKCSWKGYKVVMAKPVSGEGRRWVIIRYADKLVKSEELA